MSRSSVLRSFAMVAVLLFAVSTMSSAQSLPKKTHSHEVSLDSAKHYIQNLQKDAVQMKTKGGLFYRDVFEKLLSVKGMAAIRYYYAKMDDGTPTIVLVPVDSTGKDMTSAIVAEKTYPCPPFCDSETVLQK